MTYSLPSVESMLKALNYSNELIIICYASHIGVRHGGPCGIVS